MTEGPFAEAVEQLGGFYVVDLTDRASADEVAGLLSRVGERIASDGEARARIDALAFAVRPA